MAWLSKKSDPPPTPLPILSDCKRTETWVSYYSSLFRETTMELPAYDGHLPLPLNHYPLAIDPCQQNKCVRYWTVGCPRHLPVGIDIVSGSNANSFSASSRILSNKVQNAISLNTTTPAFSSALCSTRSFDWFWIPLFDEDTRCWEAAGCIRIFWDEIMVW